MHTPRILQSQSCVRLPNTDIVSSYDSTEKNICSRTYPQDPSPSGEGSHPPSSLDDLYLCSSSSKLEGSFLHGMNTDKNSRSQVKQVKHNPQKTLLDIVTENTISYHAKEVKKRDCHSLVTKPVHGDRVSDISRPQHKSVCKQPFSLARIIQHNQEASHSTLLEPVSNRCVYLACDTCKLVMADTCNPDTPPRDINLISLSETQMTQSSKENFCSDLSELRQSMSDSGRFMDKAQKNKTLSVSVDHQQHISRYANVTRIASVQCLDSLTIISAESSESLCGFRCTLHTKSGIEFQCGNVSELMEGKLLLAVVVSHETKRNLSHSLLRYRKFILDKLRKEYARNSFMTFDFSIQSPDDIVHEKQCDAFLHHL